MSLLLVALIDGSILPVGCLRNNDWCHLFEVCYGSATLASFPYTVHDVVSFLRPCCHVIGLTIPTRDGTQLIAIAFLRDVNLLVRIRDGLIPHTSEARSLFRIIKCHVKGQLALGINQLITVLLIRHFNELPLLFVIAIDILLERKFRLTFPIVLEGCEHVLRVLAHRDDVGLTALGLRIPRLCP